VDEYLVDLNASKAALRAGYSEKTAYSIGHANLKKVEIEKAISERRENASERTKITLDQVVREAARLALFDPRKMFKADGTPRAIQDLDDDTAACIAGLDVMNIGSGDEISQVLKYKLAPKGQAIDTLMKHLGGYEKDNGQKVGTLAEALIAGINRTKEIDE
jgi:phage terminase small subunit